ncbi:MAG TPA: zonular occludens toxin domain-containing protein [Polyangia bacterium]|jgi:hypothetical protein|nr:zonular occludens toxin domain-containing protein [Polyangia bacterium]
MAVHELTIGRSGTGKTATAVFYLVTDWLPFLHNRNYFTNLPLNLDAIGDYMVKHHPDLFSQAAVSRIRLIPQSVTDSWMEEKSGPWDYFHDQDLDGGKIVIDEIHNFIHLKSKQDYVQRWRRWLGEIRHSGCTFEAISQYETKIHPLFRHEAGLMRRLANSEDRRDKLFWVKWYDHFQLISKLRGHYSSRVWIDEYTEDAGKWARTGGGSVPLIPLYYSLYNSYSAPIAGGGKGAKLSPHPYARMTWPELLSWYLSRNVVRITFAMFFYALFAWLFVFGGIPKILDHVNTMVAQKSAAEKLANTKPQPAPTAQPMAKSQNEKPNAPVLPTPPAAPTPPPVREIPPAIWSTSGIYDATGRVWHPQQFEPITPAVAPVPAGVVPIGRPHGLQPSARQ